MTRDNELIKVSEQDKEYAFDLLKDLAEEGALPIDPAAMELCKQLVSQWLCKHRYEAVMADRKSSVRGGIQS